MNRYSRGIINSFISKENYAHINDCLADRFDYQPVVMSFLREHLEYQMQVFTTNMELELKTSSPIPGVDGVKQLKCFNKQFLLETERFILDHVLNMDDSVPTYSVSDGINLSRYGTNQSPDDILKSWKTNSGRQAQARDDNQSNDRNPYNNPSINGNNNQFVNKRNPTIQYNISAPNNVQIGNDHIQEHMQARPERSWLAKPCVQAPLYPQIGQLSPDRPIYQGSTDQRRPITKLPTDQPGIVFCDQSNIGTSNHKTQYEDTKYKTWLNSGTLPHERTEFGWSTPAADDRLLSRNVFRSNYSWDNPVANGIPTFEQRLYRRNLDRDIDEALSGPENGCIQYAHSMQSLYNRIDRKREVQSKYKNTYPGCLTEPKNNLALPSPNPSDDARYC